MPVPQILPTTAQAAPPTLQRFVLQAAPPLLQYTWHCPNDGVLILKCQLDNSSVNIDSVCSPAFSLNDIKYTFAYNPSGWHVPPAPHGPLLPTLQGTVASFAQWLAAPGAKVARFVA